MALSQLGSQLSAALSKLTQADDGEGEDVMKGVLNDVVRALMQSDVSVGLCMKLKKAVEVAVGPPGRDPGVAMNRGKQIERAVVGELERMLDPGTKPFQPIKGTPNVIMFVGLQGAGKTTTVAKYAHYYASRKWRVAMVCADTFRAGAFDQLKQNATKVRVPFYGSYTEADPQVIAAEGVAQFKSEGYEIILVDTSGRHKQEKGLFEEMVAVAGAVAPSDVVFVMDGSIGQAAMGQATAFKSAVAVGSVILTKLDGHAKGGGALSAVAATAAPITFLGTGEGFDELVAFDARRFVGKLLGKGDIKGLALELREKGIMEELEDPALVARLKKGAFSLRDLRTQLNMLGKLGSMSKIMEMIPGMEGMMAQAQANSGAPPGTPIEDPGARFKRWLVYMDSMTAGELDGVVDFTNSASPPGAAGAAAATAAAMHSRMLRVVRGAGGHPSDFQGMLAMYKQFEKMVGSMSKVPMLVDEKKLARRMKENPGDVKAQMAKVLDPRMLAQMGGLDGMMNLLGEMEAGGLMGGAGGGGGGKKGGAGGGGGGGGIPPGLMEMMKKMGGLGGLGGGGK
jgi:signal recognition particle subunit SRP54